MFWSIYVVETVLDFSWLLLTHDFIVSESLMFLISHTHMMPFLTCQSKAKSEAKSQVKSEANHVEIPEPVKAPVAKVEDPSRSNRVMAGWFQWLADLDWWKRCEKK